MNRYRWIFIFSFINLVYVIIVARILKRIFRNVFNISGNLLNFCMISLGIVFIILGIGNLSNSKIEICGMFVTLGTATIGWGINNIIKEYDNIRVAGDWRKTLYQLEQKESYTLYDLYCLNSYINPYSNENEISMLVNRVITMIFCNHTTGKKKIDSDGYKQLKDELTSYLKNGDQDIITAFDYGIKRNDMEVCNLDKYPYQDNSVVKNGTLNSMESNLVRLCCHLLLKAEWNIWTN